MNSSALHDVVLAIAQKRSTEEILTQITRRVVACLSGDINKIEPAGPNDALVRIWLVGPGDQCESCAFRRECPDQRQCLHLAASAGVLRNPKEDWQRLDGPFSRYPLGVSNIGGIAQTGQSLVVKSDQSQMGGDGLPDWAQAEGVVEFVGHALRFRGELLGVLGAFNRQPFCHQAYERLLNFAHHAAVAIGNARAFEEIDKLKHRLELENEYLQQEVKSALQFGDIIGRAPALQKIMRQIDLVAKTEANVLVTGQSGTGKELVSRAIHERSPRRDRPLIKVNCGAIPENLFESEFFGHVRGAFTSAVGDRVGRFQLADKGTLFLDEIGDIPLALQVKLLRVLQEGTFERVGEERTRKVDVRIVAATNRDLKKEVAEGRFRQDLYYRISVFPIEVPPLSQRKEDIPLLAAHFLKKTAQQLHVPVPRLTRAHVDALQHYDWPGNIREFQNTVERALILSQNGPLRFDLPQSAGASAAGPTPTLTANNATDPALISRAALKQKERASIEAALRQAGGKIFGHGGAAVLLGMNPTTLASRITTLGIDKRAFKIPPATASGNNRHLAAL